MDPTIRDTVSTAFTVALLLGLMVRYVLVPYLRDHLVKPVEDVRAQVSDNHHATAETPTLPDRIEDVHTEVRALARVMDVHMSWSEEKSALVDRELSLIKRKLKRQTKRERRNLP